MHEFSQNSSWNIRFKVSDLRRETRWFTSLNLSVSQRHLLSSWWTRCRCLGNKWRPGGPDVSHMFLATCFMFLLFLLFFYFFSSFCARVCRKVERERSRRHIRRFRRKKAETAHIFTWQIVCAVPAYLTHFPLWSSLFSNEQMFLNFSQIKKWFN